MKSEQPEQALTGTAEPLVGPGEYRPHVGSLVLAVKRVERTPGLAEFRGEYGKTEPGMGSGTRRHQHQGQWQLGTQRDDVVNRLLFGSHPVLPDASGKQLARLGNAHQVDEHRLRTLGNNE